MRKIRGASVKRFQPEHTFVAAPMVQDDAHTASLFSCVVLLLEVGGGSLFSSGCPPALFYCSKEIPFSRRGKNEFGVWHAEFGH